MRANVGKFNMDVTTNRGLFCDTSSWAYIRHLSNDCSIYNRRDLFSGLELYARWASYRSKDAAQPSSFRYEILCVLTTIIT